MNTKNLKGSVTGVFLGLAFIVGIFLVLGALAAWMFYVVPWVYNHAPRLGLNDDLIPFCMGAASAFAGPAMVVGAVIGWSES